MERRERLPDSNEKRKDLVRNGRDNCRVMENWSSGAVDGLECASKDQDKPNPPVARAHDADAINRWPEGNGFNSLGPNSLDFRSNFRGPGIVPDALSLPSTFLGG